MNKTTRRAFSAVFAIALLFVSGGASYSQTDPSAGSSGAVVLTNARVIDGLGGKPLEDVTVILADGLVRNIGSVTQAQWPAGAKVVNCRGKTIVPGLMSDHSHVGLIEGASTGPQNYTQTNLLQALHQYQAYGITTIVSLGLNRDLFYPLRDSLRTGKLKGADLFGADRGIGVPNGAPPVPVGSDGLYRVATPAEAIEAVQEMGARHPDLIKIWVDDFHGSVPVKMQPPVYRAVIEESHKRSLRVAAHVYYLEDAKELVRDGVDILAHGVRDRPVDGELIALMKARGTWYIPTLDLDEATYIYAEQPEWMKQPFFRRALSPALREQFADPAWRAKTLANKKVLDVSKDALAMNKRNLKTLYDAGVHIGFGTDSGAMPLRIPGFAEHRELQLMVEAGLTPLQAIDVATANAAKLLQLNDRGVLAPGMHADLVLLDGNPAVDIRNSQLIHAVYQRGQLVSGRVASYVR
ncbi:MAG TPA: amidohydrolase family protein [Bryobacteraceae bacterium]|nr:amidohydrolase family protein [Bryobacteraceae bacterium]